VILFYSFFDPFAEEGKLRKKTRLLNFGKEIEIAFRYYL